MLTARPTTRRRIRLALWWSSGLLLAYALLGFFAAPPIVKSKLEQALTDALHRRVTVQAVRVNPFAPSVTVRGLVVRERADDAVFASFEELYVNAAWTSIFRFAPVIDAVTLAKPQLRLARHADRTYNVQDLLDELRARPKSDAPPPKFAVFNIRLLDGRVDFEDRAAGETHVVSELRVGIPFLSSLPTHADVEVTPELGMKLNGALLGLQGETLPFEGSRTTVFNLNVHGFDVTRVMEYLPFEPRAKLRSALLDARLAIAFEQPPGRAPEVAVSGAAAIRDFALLDAQDRPVLAWERLGVELARVEPLVPRIDLKSVQLAGAELHLRRERDGSLNVAALGPPAGASAEPAEAPGAAPPLALKIDDIGLAFKRLRFTDATTQPAFETSLQEAKLEGSGFELREGKRAEWALRARSEAGEALLLTATASATPVAAEGRLDLRGVVLPRYAPYVERAANLRIDAGTLDLGFAFKWQDEALQLADAGLALRALRARLPDEKTPFLRLGELRVTGAAADTAARAASLGDIAVRDVALALRREKDGVLNIARIARPAEAGAAPGAPWRLALAKAALERGAVAFEDFALAEPAQLRIAPIELTAEGLSTEKGKQGAIRLRAGIDKAGTLALSGPLALEPPAARLEVVADAIGLAPVQRYLDERMHLAITAGTVSAKGVATLEAAAGAPLQAAYAGTLEIAGFASIDKRSTQDLLQWKRLAFRGIDFALEPLRVSVGEIALEDYYARVILSAEGRLNLQELAVAPEAPPQPAQPAPARPLADARIGRITARDGRVNFSDFFIRPNYSANLTGIGGTITEMTPARAGDIELLGKLDNAAPVEIRGRVNPLAPELFLDLQASAKDIELSPLTPYSVKYAGYGIERGKLSVSAKYSVEKRKLVAENRIYLDQLTFGERVESPTATKLPVTLAIALLKDRNGVIDINLPISGSLDDPQFSVGGVIVQVLVNLIAKAVTSPFALLGALAGSGEELSYVEFAPGEAALAPGAEARLGSLASALLERPGLRLDVAGRAAPDPDEAGLRRVSLRRKVRAQKFNDLRRAGTAPPSVDAVAVAPEEYETFLRRAYEAEKFDKPRNALGFARELPVPEMEALMLEHTPAGAEDLRRLANARAQAAKEWLVGRGKVPAERVFVVAPRLADAQAKDGGGSARVEFGLK